MMDIEKYLSVPHVTGGRSMDGMDCWSLCLFIRRELGLPELPDLGHVGPTDAKGMKEGYRHTVSYLKECSPKVGALAAVFRGLAFIHVGVVVDIDGRLAVVETNPKTGVRWLRISAFESQYAKVVFYCDRDFPE